MPTYLPEETLNSTEQLKHFLIQNGISEDAVNILKDEGVDGYAFMELTEIDLKELKIKIGPRKRILNLINACHNVSSQEILLDEVNLVQLNTQNQIFNNENVQNKENILSTTENSSSPKCQKALVPFENKSKEVKN
ncbi:hypothetical protein CAJAP_08381 [Camponotus japonicus]